LYLSLRIFDNHSAEFLKRLLDIAPFLKRLLDIAPLLKLMGKVQDYYVGIGNNTLMGKVQDYYVGIGNNTVAARVAMRRLEHLYYKHNDLVSLASKSRPQEGDCAENRTQYIEEIAMHLYLTC
ncbi:hypothetical protein T484DRAFT_1818567, partial [Baffinella frigidus]